MSKWLGATIAAAISAWACGVAAQHGTPVDDALPVVAVIVTILAAMTWPAIGLAVPLLIGGEIVIADERLRLLWIGVVVGVAFGTALLEIRDSRLEIRSSASNESRISNLESRSIAMTVAAIILLRWIPLHDVLVWRELLLLAIAIGIVAALRWSAIGVAISVAVALFTPAIPLRTFGVAIAVLVVAGLLRWAGMPRLRAEVPASAVLAIMLLFFPWSGVLSRALPLAIRGLPRSTPRAPVAMALAPGQSVSLDVPGGAGALILSGANMARLRSGTIVGVAGSMPVRVGDIADWGFLRREHFYGSRNVIPRDPAGVVHGYGQSAWVDGAGRLPIPPHAATLRVTADPHLPPNVRLQIDAFELVRR